MTRTVYVNGESMVYVRGPAGSSIANLKELGLAETAIQIQMIPTHEDVLVDAWGKAPIDVQFMLATVNVSMSLIHFDPDILEECVRLSMGAGSAPGRMGRAGTLLGNGFASQNALNSLIRLNIASPIQQRPWCFFSSYLPNGAPSWPLGTQRSVVQLNWRVIPYTLDPWQGGAGALNYPLFSHTLDS